jgi:tRNA threonylcarbamoyladenosine biosynthesis protein TsaE
MHKQKEDIALDRYQIHLESQEETSILGVELGKIALPGDVVCLDGDLGAGKTTLCQSIALGLGVPEDCYVTSPSFAILHEYAGRIPLYHMDFYRLNDAVEVADLGFEEYFYEKGITIIEWSKRAEGLMPTERLNLEIIINQDLSREVYATPSRNFAARFAALVIALTVRIPAVKVKKSSSVSE